MFYFGLGWLKSRFKEKKKKKSVYDLEIPFLDIHLPLYVKCLLMSVANIHSFIIHKSKPRVNVRVHFPVNRGTWYQIVCALMKG